MTHIVYDCDSLKLGTQNITEATLPKSCPFQEMENIVVLYTYLGLELFHKIIWSYICILYVSVFCHLHLYHLQLTITREN